MPPKKSTERKAKDSNAGDDKFRWTPENERNLCMLALAYANPPRAIFEMWAEAMPAGASFEGMRQRSGKLRREQRSIYEKHGWDTEGKAEVLTNGATGKKHAATADPEDKADAEKPVKKTKGAAKPRAKKIKSAAAPGEGDDVAAENVTGVREEPEEV